MDDGQVLTAAHNCRNGGEMVGKWRPGLHVMVEAETQFFSNVQLGQKQGHFVRFHQPLTLW